MAVRLRRPSPDELKALRQRVGDDRLTYDCVGASLDDQAVLTQGLTRREWSRSLVGPSAFQRGCEALQGWAIHRAAGLVVEAAGPPRVGEVVAMAASIPLGWIEVTCRVVATVAEHDRFGFAYGTLPIHPERGEESFVLERTDEGADFVVSAVSAAVHPLARIAPPIADRLQERATQRYLQAMADIAA